MPFTSKIKKYEIDLYQEQNHRWSNVIRNEKNNARLMIENSKKDLGWIGGTFFDIIKKPIGILYKQYGGLYIGEMKSWAEALHLSINEVIALNCQYELNHAYTSLNFGCTAAVTWVKGLGMVHLRNMDWELDAMGRATRIFEFRKGKRKFITIGVPGQIGVLSGMLPGKYSVTINYAPTDASPWFNGYGPLFLLREVFEECDTYEEAVKELKNNKLATNVFYLVCGTKRDQACVIERTKKEYSVRYIKDSYLTLANHFKSQKFIDLNYDDELFEDSCNREDAITNKIEKLGSSPSITKLANCLDIEPALNEDTCQQMIFVPKTGEYKVWRRIR